MCVNNFFDIHHNHGIDGVYLNVCNVKIYIFDIF